MMDAKDIAERIEGYFSQSAARSASGKSGKRTEEPDAGEKYPPTMAGLAAALGMPREELLATRANTAAGRLIANARVRVEAFAEEKLFDKNAASGAKFALARNAPIKDEGDGKALDPSLLTDEELEARIKRLCGE
ncbi:MAG: hypothetical protein ACOYIR_02305 [Christensenellales bacterium]